MNPLDVRFFTEAGGSVGLGHLTRCVALHDALEALGHSCELIVAGEAPSHIVGPRHVTITDWRTPETARDASRDADIAVIDSYMAAPDVYAAVAENAAVGVYLDDTARLPYPPGIVVNGNPEAARLDFRCGPETTLLLGVECQLLRSEFAESTPRDTRDVVARILVISGGSDAGNVRTALTEIAGSAYPAAIVDVVETPCTASELREAMLAADVAITAAGQTLYELAATGTPTVAVCVADNQVAQAHAFERAGALALAGEWDHPNTATRAEELIRGLAASETRTAMSVAGRALVDGRGTKRVADRCVVAAQEVRRLQ